MLYFFNVKSNGATNVFTSSAGLILLSQWMHLAISVTTNNLQFYQNGVLFQQLALTNPNMERVYRYDNRIGASAWNYCPTFCFTGIMDEFRVYSIALTS
jgi:hypothetical protein